MIVAGGALILYSGSKLNIDAPTAPKEIEYANEAVHFVDDLQLKDKPIMAIYQQASLESLAAISPRASVALKSIDAVLDNAMTEFSAVQDSILATPNVQAYKAEYDAWHKEAGKGLAALGGIVLLLGAGMMARVNFNRRLRAIDYRFEEGCHKLGLDSDGSVKKPEPSKLPPYHPGTRTWGAC